MRRMLFFDIDGTLVNSRDRTIPDSAGRAIRLARRQATWFTSTAAALGAG